VIALSKQLIMTSQVWGLHLCCGTFGWLHSKERSQYKRSAFRCTLVDCCTCTVACYYVHVTTVSDETLIFVVYISYFGLTRKRLGMHTRAKTVALSRVTLRILT
jgi:hypothetical protein